MSMTRDGSRGHCGTPQCTCLTSQFWIQALTLAMTSEISSLLAIQLGALKTGN